MPTYYHYRSARVARSNETSKIPKVQSTKRAQSALEYLIIYAWAVLIAAVVIVVIYFFIFAPSSIIQPSCIFSGGTYCQDVIFGSNSMQSSLALLLTNTQDYAIANVMLQVNSSSMPSMSVKCSPSLVLPGGDIFCILTASQQAIATGSLVSGSLQLSAVPCPSKNLAQCQTVQRQTYSGSFTSHVAPLASLSASTMTLSASFQNPAANGAPDLLTATVKILGIIIPGATVSFTQSNTFSTLSPAIATTDSNGNAESYISSSQVGYTLVTASFAGATNSMLIDFTAPATVVIMAPGGACNLQTSGTVVLAVNSVPYTCSQFPLKFHYQSNSQYSYSFSSNVPINSGTQYVFNSVGGCGTSALTGLLTSGSSGSNCTISSSYTEQYYLTELSNPSGYGVISPLSSWFNSGSVITINAMPNTGYVFVSWNGIGAGNYTGTSAINSITLQGPITEQANFQSSLITSTSTTSTSSTSTTVGNIPYLYCVGTSFCSDGITSPGYNETYYAPISSTGVGAWSSTTTYPINTMNYGTCSIYNGFIYCVGNNNPSNVLQKQVYYAPISSTGIGAWTGTASYPVSMFFSGCSIYNGYLFCVGTFGTSSSTEDYYAPLSIPSLGMSNGVGAWTGTASYPMSMFSDGCSIYNGYIYCVGSSSEYTSPYVFNTVYYAPISSTGIGTWISSTSYPVPMTNAGCSVYGSNIYCVGDQSGSYKYTYYAPLSSTGVGAWTKTTSYPIQMAGAGCSIYNNYIYCVGSFSASPFNYVYYAPISSTGIGTWTSTTNYPIKMCSAYCSTTNSGGGYFGGGGPTSGVWASGTTTSTSTSTTSLSTTSTTTISSIPYIYCVGSYDAPDNQSYYAPITNPGLGSWQKTTPYPINGVSPNSCSIYNSDIYCVGENSTSLVYYAPISSTGIGTWNPSTTYPIPASWGGLGWAGCSTYNGYIYCVGDDDGLSDHTAYYAPVSSTGVGTWTQATSYPLGLDDAGCSILDGYIYCVGTIASAYNNEVYYAPISSTGIGTWTASTFYPYPPGSMYGDGCSISSSGYIYCVGNWGTSMVYYAPITTTGIGSWQGTTPLPGSTITAGCAIYGSYLYCIGGGWPGSAIYYSQISSTGVGPWTQSASYPLDLLYNYCQIPGSGGGWLGGGGPSSFVATTVSTSTSTTSTISPFICPPSSPAFTSFGSGVSPGSWPDSPQYTLTTDGWFGNIGIGDISTTSDNGGNWTWDFGSVKTGTFNAIWYSQDDGANGDCPGGYTNFTQTWYGSADGVAWTKFAQYQFIGTTAWGLYGSSSSPIVSSTPGAYRYVKLSTYSSNAGETCSYGYTYVDSVCVLPGSTTTSTSTSTTSLSTTTALSTCAPNAYGNPTLATYGSCGWGSSYLVTPSATLGVPDGQYGDIDFFDTCTNADAGANWTWDFGSVVAGTYNSIWYTDDAGDSPCAAYGPNDTVTWYASADGNTWTEFTTNPTNLTTTYNWNPPYSYPIRNSSITGSYRYIKVSTYSNGPGTTCSGKDVEVDSVCRNTPNGAYGSGNIISS
jgi:uncharacterized protein (UPF0333 family)